MSPIVFVPGLLCSAEVFAPQMAALWRFGPVTAASTQGDGVADVAARILEAAPPRFALAGISMGGYIAFEIMRQAPERVIRLALIDTSARPDTPEQTAARRALLREAQRGDFLTTALESLTGLLHPARRTDPTLRSICLRMARAVGLHEFERQLNLVIGRPDSGPFLAKVGVPTTVIVGDADALTPVDRAREMVSGIREAKLVIVPECGHLSTIEQPDRISSALTDWASGH